MIYSEWMLATKLELVPGGFLSETLGHQGSKNLSIDMNIIPYLWNMEELENHHPQPY